MVYYQGWEDKEPMKKLFALILCLCLLGSAALADSLPIYHQPTKNQAPYETVNYLNEPPFAADAPLLEVDVLGIRQGDCILITCGRMRMLVDGGEGWRFPYVDAYLKEHGIDHFDYFFLTHAHDDHLEMQEKLIAAGYTVGEVLSPYDDSDSYTLWNPYKKQLKAAGIPFRKVVTGDVIDLGGVSMKVYRRDDKGITMNNHSACLMLQFGEARMFLAADIGGETQHWLLDNFDAAEFKCDVYKSAHHNRTATVTEFLTAMDPGLVVNTNTRSSTMTGDGQQGRRHIPRYYISTGTIHLSTDGAQWYVWQEPMDAK